MKMDVKIWKVSMNGKNLFHARTRALQQAKSNSIESEGKVMPLNIYPSLRATLSAFSPISIGFSVVLLLLFQIGLLVDNIFNVKNYWLNDSGGGGNNLHLHLSRLLVPINNTSRLMQMSESHAENIIFAKENYLCIQVRRMYISTCDFHANVMSKQCDGAHFPVSAQSSLCYLSISFHSTRVLALSHNAHPTRLQI